MTFCVSFISYRYYNTKYKKAQAPHVVMHYAAGARLIGLTEKQLTEHLKKIQMSNSGMYALLIQFSRDSVAPTRCARSPSHPDDFLPHIKVAAKPRCLSSRFLWGLR